MGSARLLTRHPPVRERTARTRPGPSASTSTSPVATGRTPLVATAGTLVALQRQAGNAAVVSFVATLPARRTGAAGPRVVQLETSFIAHSGTAQQLKVTVSEQKLATHTMSMQESQDPTFHWAVIQGGLGHRPVSWGTKTLFPPSWPQQTVVAAIKAVYESPGPWVPHGTNDEDKSATVNGVAVTIRRKVGQAGHVTSAWPTGPNLVNPHAEWQYGLTHLNTINAWVGYYATEYQRLATYEPAAWAKFTALATSTIGALQAHRGRAVEAAFAGTYTSALQLLAWVQQQQEAASSGAAIERIRQDVEKPSAPLAQLKAELGKLMNSSTYDAIEPILKRIAELEQK
ncbi:hypothetical protein Cch01nite_42600 [Cellulomonas chitinilytica]|uniref:Uncharacterized protein n=1 Tax=Cellulomonas chitinilytica TaxID=398759 RepID=A0A919P8I3_9CELL|nr:hypothetical protein [Cellulomonas chitinilytica]GIG23536.1 hypothetical protein Cch01nite_42600 [Cellulomonas chitinilytica]